MHNHAHCDHPRPAKFGFAFAVGITLNLGFVIGEVIFGFTAHSLSLVADAGHNFGDVLGLGMAWTAALLAVRPPTASLTYGYRRSSILSALGNSCLLLIGVGAIVWDAILRLAHPTISQGSTVIIVAAVGIAVNGLTAFLFASGRHGELNVRSAYLHMLADAIVSAGVVLAGIAIKLTDSPWIDPVVALIIAALIAKASWSVLREATGMAMDAVPTGLDPKEVHNYLSELPGVTEVSDLHIWAMSTSENALTAHLVAPDGLGDAMIIQAEQGLKARFGISHCTIQVARTRGPGCSLTP